MPQRSWLLGLVVLALAAGLAVSLILSSGAASDPAAPLGSSEVRPADARGGPDLDPEPVGDQAIAGTADGRRAVGQAAPGTWRLAGRVVPDGPWPADERLFVEAGDLRVPVGPGGAFTLDVPEDRDAVELELDGRYLGRERGLVVERASLDSARPLEVPATLGAWLRVDLVATGDVTLDELEAATGQVAVWQGEPAWRRGLVGMGAGRFEAGAIPVEQLVSLSISGERFVDTGAEDLRAFAGQPLDVTLEVRRGATVAGRVVDGAGAPVADARLSLARRNPLPGSMVTYVDRTAARSDAAGRFRYEGLDEGDWRLEVRGEGFLDGAEDLGQLADGDRLEDLDVTLARGLALRGTTRLAGGEPVPAELRLTAAGSPRSGGATVRAQADGSFAIDGLEPGGYVLAAAHEDEGGAVWRAPARELELTATGGDLAGLELVLTAGDRLTGVVTSDEGAPLDRFTLRARPLGADLAVLSKGALTERYRKAEGRFELVGLAPGSWDVTVEAKGHAPSRPVRVQVPEGPHEVAFTLDRLAMVTGRVRGPDGTPVADAEVQAVAPGAADKDRTDAEGRFELDGVAPGAVTLTAELDGLRGAAPEELLLAPGEERDGVELALRVGARIEGRVDPSIEGFEARPVLASPEDSFENEKTLSDADGGFVFEGLEPGTWSVMFDWMANAGDDWTVGYAAREEVEVELREGETTQVVLGAPRPGSVQLTGQVTDGGAPQATYLVYVYPEHNDTKKPAAMPLTIARTDAEGRYGLELPGPGTYHFSVGPDTTFQVRFLETVAAAGQATLDFALPGCAIAGRVELPDGTPAARHPLMLVREGAPVDSRTFGDLHSGGADADGSFRFEGIQPGRYLLRAGGWGLDSGGMGARVLADLEVREGAPLEDLVVVVDEEAVVGGRVLDATGAPVSGARLDVFDADDSQLFVWREHLSDHAGAFRLLGVGAGAVTLRATAPDGRTTAIELDLTPGDVRDVELRLGG